MTKSLIQVYYNYLECLNSQAWKDLSKFVDDRVSYNDTEIKLTGYRKMLEQNYREIPDLHFNALLLVTDSDYVACRLQFDCTPVGIFLDLPVNGRRVKFTDNVFYRIKDKKIEAVWSVIDKRAIEKQIR